MPSSPDTSFRAIQVSGADRVEFLQGQLTNDIALLSPENPLLAGWNNPKGRLLCLTWVLDWADSVWLLIPKALADGVARRLRMFVLRADVQVSLSDRPVVQLPPINNTHKVLGVINCFDGTYDFGITLPSGAGLGMGGGHHSDSANAFRLANIRAGIPTIWGTTQEEFVPQMVNLDLLGGISFSKGCYVGQEIVARTHNLGRIKRRMYRYTTNAADSIPNPGDTIYSGDKGAGKIVDAASDGQTVELLVVIRIESLKDRLSLADGRLLTQEPLPYDVPESI